MIISAETSSPIDIEIPGQAAFLRTPIAVQVPFTPPLVMGAVNVQAALEELLALMALNIQTPSGALTARALAAILGDNATSIDKGMNGRSGANDGPNFTAIFDREFAIASNARRGADLQLAPNSYHRLVTPGVINRPDWTWGVGWHFWGRGGNSIIASGADVDMIQILGTSQSQGGMIGNVRFQGTLVDGSASAAIAVPTGQTALDTMQIGNYFNGAPVAKSGNFVSNIDLGSFGDFGDIMFRSTRRSAKGVVSSFLGYGMRLGTVRDSGSLTTSGAAITDAVRDNGLGAGMRSFGPGMHDRHRGTASICQNILDEDTDNKAYTGQVHNGKTPNQPVLDGVTFDLTTPGTAGNEGRRRAERAAWDATASDVHWAPLDYLRKLNTRGESYEGGTVYYYERGALVEGVHKGMRHSAIVRMCNLRGSKTLGSITYADCDGVHFDDDVWDSQGLGVRIEGGNDAHGSLFIKDAWYGGLSVVDHIRANLRVEVFNAAWGDRAGAPFSLENDLAAIHVSGTSSGVKLHEVACSLRDIAAANGQKYNVVFDTSTQGCTLFSGQISAFRNGGAAFVDRGTNNIVGDGVLGVIRVRPVSGNYMVERTDRRILVDASAGPVTITIPFYGQWYSQQPLEIIKIDGSGNAVTIVPPTGSQTINGATSRTLTSQYQLLRLKPLTAEWGIF